MGITTKTIGNVVVVTPRGRLRGGIDTGELDEKLYELHGRGDSRVVINLGEVEWMNSSGLAILIHHWKKCLERGANVCLANLTKSISQIVVIDTLLRIYQDFDSVEQAVQSFDGQTD